MTKKTKTYILIVVVVLIWGVVIYNIASAVSGSDDTVEIQFQPDPINLNLENKRDTFNLIADYRDPFLGVVTKAAVQRTKKKAKPAKVQTPKEPLPSITYSGYMRDPENGTPVFFINVNNEQLMMKLTEVVGQIKLLSGSDKQVVLIYNEQRLTIPLSN